MKGGKGVKKRHQGQKKFYRACPVNCTYEDDDMRYHNVWLFSAFPSFSAPAKRRQFDARRADTMISK